ncbi:MAG: glycoside hydrolase family 5 protein [Prevotella sp.]|nr:glycoside hydrolase family 5 protein [Prevotella sp.]
MRSIFLWLAASVSLVATAGDGTFETAREAVRNMKVGWNLGNTFDSNSGDTLLMWQEANKNRTVKDYETMWGQKETRPELFKMMKEAGFNAIRLPVTWYPHMEATFADVRGYNDPKIGWTYTPWLPSKDDIGTQIQKAWMKRIHEVVDYIIGQGMYCILNVHHDTGDSNTAWLIADEGVYEKQHTRFEAIWKQIAEEFRDYDEHLLFEGYNEMLDIKRSWCFASFAAEGSYNEAIAKSAYNAINSYAQTFVNTVRATGGNNSQRNLVVCTYGACDGGGTWNKHLKDPLKEMKVPDDSAEGHIIFEVHCYPDVMSLTTVKNEVNDRIQAWNEFLVAKGAPMIVGEWGTNTDKGYEKYRNNLLGFARYFVEQTKANDIATFHWMGLSDGASRTVPEFNQKDLAEAIIKGYYGEGGPSAVQTVKAADATGVTDVYSLNGTKLYSGISRSQARQQLPKGIYLMGGRKVVVGR